MKKADNDRTVPSSAFILYGLYFTVLNTKACQITLTGFTGAVGIEPTSMVLETTVLPLNYAPTFVLIEPTNCILA